MYGLITRLVAHRGRRDELALMLLDPSIRRHGCHSYVVAHDLSHGDGLWVTEVWSDAATHQSWSMDMRESGVWRPVHGLIAAMEDPIMTRPLGGVGI